MKAFIHSAGSGSWRSNLGALFWSAVVWGGRALCVFLLALGLTHSEAQIPSDVAGRIALYSGGREFDLLRWMLAALGFKTVQAALGAADYLDEAGRIRLVREYFHYQAERERLENAIARRYADPAVDDPEAATQDQRLLLAEVTARLRQLQPLAEGVLEGQISTVLGEQGLGWGGQPVPPVSFRFTPLPLLLVVSPRTEIRQAAVLSLDGSLTLDEQVALETRVERELDVSALVVPIGGLGTYPTMVAQSSDLNWIVSVGAHEWAHNYFSLRPLGLGYDKSPELRTMNETAASIIGDEIGRLVMRRYYPDCAPPPPPFPNVLRRAEQSLPMAIPEKPDFDYEAEMHRTRVQVDELLRQGLVERAEEYMEIRRRFFWDHGYQIRKLNQAYFAFYGAYAADAGSGITGEDPVGPAVVLLRRRSPALADFVMTISGFGSFEELRNFLKLAE